MCHLILLLPLLAIPVFWLAPIPVAGPAYAVVVAVSAWLYWYVIQSQRRSVVTGRESLLRGIGEVVARNGKSLRVRVQSEVWSAGSAQRLRPGDRVEVIGVDGLRLEVRRLQGADDRRDTNSREAHPII